MRHPPIQRSELADHLNAYRPYRWVTGPAGQPLVTQTDGLPQKRAPVEATIGITGNEGRSPFYSDLIPGSDDGSYPWTVSP